MELSSETQSWQRCGSLHGGNDLQPLPLGPPVLEPDLHLLRRHSEVTVTSRVRALKTQNKPYCSPAERLPLLTGDVLLLLEDPLQLVDLPARERGPVFLGPDVLLVVVDGEVERSVLAENIFYEVPGEVTSPSTSFLQL